MTNEIAGQAGDLRRRYLLLRRLASRKRLARVATVVEHALAAAALVFLAGIVAGFWP